MKEFIVNLLVITNILDNNLKNNIMNEIYWITRLDHINIFLGILLAISIVALFTLCINFLFEYDGDKERLGKVAKNICFISIPVIIVPTLFLIFIPTTKEAYQIYGIGGTIDYIKSNKEAQKIPDKAIKALNCFLDNECKTDTTKNE